MSPKKEIFPEWLLGYQACDFMGGFKGSSKKVWLNGENLGLSKERFPGGWLFTATREGLSTSIVCLRGMAAVQNPESIGAIYKGETGELVKAKFSVRTLFSKYDSYRDSLLSSSDEKIISMMYDLDIDWICEVEVLKALPVLNLVINERSADGELSVRHLDSGRFDPSKLGCLGEGLDYPSFEFIGTFGYLEKLIYLRIFQNRVSMGIVEDRGGEENERVIAEEDLREMFGIYRQSFEISKFGDRLVGDSTWMPNSVDQVNKLFGSVGPDFVFDPSN